MATSRTDSPASPRLGPHTGPSRHLGVRIKRNHAEKLDALLDRTGKTKSEHLRDLIIADLDGADAVT